ncbi:MAG: methyltransferase domain-containing protein [Gemmatimonadota bacterium]
MSHAHFDESYGANPAENYERFFVPSIGEPLAKELVSRAGVRPTDRVLDVACGTGIVARLLSEVVDAGGAVTGLDPNGSMLAVARTVTPPRAGIKWYQAPAEDMPLAPESFDVVLCQMGLQFMGDRPAALAEMHRVLKGDGRLLLSVPGPITGVFAALASAMERHVGPRAAQFVSQVFSLHDVDELERLMREAGFLEVVVEATSHVLELPPPRQFLRQYIHSTPLAAVVSEVDAVALAALEQEVLDAWAEFVRDDVLEHRLRLVVTSGTKTAA